VGLRTDLKNVIVVYPFDEETAHRACDSAMKKTLTKYRHLTRQGVHFELFHEMFFAIDLKRHVLIPKHVLMTPAEVQDEIVVRERIDPEKCASISAHDPMARYVGATVGSTVKIVAYRAASVEISYRRCVSEKTIRVSAPPQSAAEAEDEELEDDVREEEQPEADD
jgi:DNA-directed RNA polymerase subunit H (RpoH/RPB5)